MIRKLTLLLALVAMAGIAQAATMDYSLDANHGISYKVAIAPDTKMISVATDGSSAKAGDLYLFARQGSDFDFSQNISDQADFVSSNAMGSASLSIADWSHPALTAGSTWYFAVVNTGTSTANGSLTTTQSASSAPVSDIEVNFAAPKTDVGTCDVAPWSDTTLMADGKTTIGDFRRGLVEQAATNLSSEIHSPVPIRVQACWDDLGGTDSGTDSAGSYTLAQAGPSSFWIGAPGMPDASTFYAWAPTQRLAGTYACNLTTSITCDEPDIVVWYNKNSAAIGNYSDAADAATIISVTMHEMTHGLGFLSLMSLQDSDSGSCPAKIGDFPTLDSSCQHYNDAYTENIGHTVSGKVTNFADLSVADRAAALTDNDPLVWMDKLLAANLDNALHTHSYPGNLVQLYKASTIQGGSTMSHLNGATHPGQLMDAVIQHNSPQTLGLAEPILEKLGWANGPLETPIAGTWSDPAHTGHGIDFEPTTRDAAGDLYTVIFYTYGQSGLNEFYFSSGRLRNGHYESSSTPGQPAPMARPVYDPAIKQATYPDINGSLSIDFTSYAAASPACADHSDAHLAVMHWSIGPQSGDWCIKPLVDRSIRPAAAQDLNGLWNGGPNDSGWGFSLGDAVTSSGIRLAPLLVYYYDKYNQSRWAQAEVHDYKAGDSVDLYQPTGYGRLAAKKKVTYAKIGTLTLNLNAPDDSNPPNGSNTISFDTGSESMSRGNAPVRMLSLPPGK